VPVRYGRKRKKLADREELPEKSDVATHGEELEGAAMSLGILFTHLSEPCAQRVRGSLISLKTHKDDVGMKKKLMQLAVVR